MPDKPCHDHMKPTTVNQDRSCHEPINTNDELHRAHASPDSSEEDPDDGSSAGGISWDGKHCLQMAS